MKICFQISKIHSSQTFLQKLLNLYYVQVITKMVLFNLKMLNVTSGWLYPPYFLIRPTPIICSLFRCDSQVIQWTFEKGLLIHDCIKRCRRWFWRLRQHAGGGINFIELLNKRYTFFRHTIGLAASTKHAIIHSRGYLDIGGVESADRDTSETVSFARWKQN